MTSPAAPVTQRPFRMSDAMILMASISVALIWDRGRILDPMRWISDLTSRPTGFFWRLTIAATNALEFVPPFLTVMSVTVLGLRLRRPRPPLRQLAQQPGTIACAVASLVMMPATLAVLATHSLAGRSLGAAWARTVADLQPENLGGFVFLIGFAIAVTWLVLMAKKHWLPEPGWLDRLGRLLGVGWMLMIIGVVILHLISIARVL